MYGYKLALEAQLVAASNRHLVSSRSKSLDPSKCALAQWVYIFGGNPNLFNIVIYARLPKFSYSKLQKN